MGKSNRVETYINHDDNDEGSRLKGSRGILALVAICGFLTFMVGVAMAGFLFTKSRYVSPGPSEMATIFTVPKGVGLSTIAAKLESNDIISSANVFKTIIKLDGNETSLKAGEYEIPAKASMNEIFEILQSGKSMLYPFTAPEGLTSAQIVRSLKTVQTLVNDNPAVPLEGSLLPETYLTPRNMKYSQVLADMQKAQTDVINTLWESRDENLPIKTKQDAIILASIVEKETGVGSERDMVAGVFINRLNKGMRLQTDPTIIYGISKGEPLYNKKGQRRTLYRSEIDRKTPWNTYQIDGLPPTPICNPGADAIAAVLKPAQTEYLFFVADGTGGHAFAKTVREHNNNVNKWRKIERQRQAAQRRVEQ